MPRRAQARLSPSSSTHGDGERCLETFLVVPPGLGAIDSRGQGCCSVSSHAQGGSPQSVIPAPNISGARVG